MGKINFNIDDKKYVIVFNADTCIVTDTQTKKKITLDCVFTVIDMVNILRG